MGTGTRIRTGTGTQTGSGRAEERRRIARNRTRDVDAMWETGDIWVERENNVDKNGVGSVATNPDNLDNKKEAGGEAHFFCFFVFVCISLTADGPQRATLPSCLWH